MPGTPKKPEIPKAIKIKRVKDKMSKSVRVRPLPAGEQPRMPNPGKF